MRNWHYYKPNQALDTVLERTPNDYRATTEYALFLLGVNDKPSPPYRRIYVRQREVAAWIAYLAAAGIEEVKAGSGALPGLILDPVAHLPRSLQSHPHVVNLDRLLKDLHGASPRIFENSPEVIRKLRKLA
jgi:hypothetical protein